MVPIGHVTRQARHVQSDDSHLRGENGVLVSGKADTRASEGKVQRLPATTPMRWKYTPANTRKLEILSTIDELLEHRLGPENPSV